VFITLKKGGENTVAEKLKKIKIVTDVAQLYGEYDIIAKVETKNMEELQKFLTKELRSIAEVDRTSTMITVQK
jgi:DNA-binding Lrp family transcriptional regulator